MKAKTKSHLATARTNHDLAITMIAESPGESTPSANWAVVIAFYAAMHSINAYLYEALSYEPRDHQERRNWVFMDANLKAISAQYAQLLAYSYEVRYTPGRRLNATAIQGAMQSLREIERHITGLLSPAV